ncbi:hypothetical protein ACO22_07586 [Paracoccidioides brasiliensis]|uniref:Uncharacterized protein n=1 Tax=Paracoccidioides brasiliensis TaxID=121759 RepID=A0A1D2J4C7_PARBR|nr:hypothetical protein ACO22_07586 [Paracoccidioides brasiliensis]
MRISSVFKRQGLVEGFDQIIKACEYGMVSATIMKKQYQDIFNANEKEKQKRKRSNRRITREGGLTREEAQNLIIPPVEPAEQPVIQPPDPAAPEPAPCSRAPPTYVNSFFNKYFKGKYWSDKANAICQHVLASDSDGK